MFQTVEIIVQFFFLSSLRLLNRFSLNFSFYLNKATFNYNKIVIVFNVEEYQMAELLYNNIDNLSCFIANLADYYFLVCQTQTTS